MRLTILLLASLALTACGGHIPTPPIECINTRTGETVSVDRSQSHADWYYIVDAKGYGQYIDLGDWRYSAWRCRVVRG